MPISLERCHVALRPFRLRADPALPHWVSADYFDGAVLASYLVSTGSFYHPISRRELTREDAASLDKYLAENQLDPVHVELVYVHAHSKRQEGGNAVLNTAASSATHSRVAAARAEAASVLGTLFGGTGPLRRRSARTRDPTEESVQIDGGLTVVDDDALPSHDRHAMEDAAASAERDAFPALPGSLASDSAATARSMPTATAAAAVDVSAAGGWLIVASRELPPSRPQAIAEDAALSEGERERRGRARLTREREAWAAALAEAARKEAAERLAESAGAEAVAAERRAEELRWARLADRAAHEDATRARAQAQAAETAAAAAAAAAAEDARLSTRDAAAAGDARVFASARGKEAPPRGALKSAARGAVARCDSCAAVQDFRLFRRAHELGRTGLRRAYLAL